MRLAAKERILLHLLDYAKFAEAVQVPHEMAQDRIASRAGIDLRHFSQYVRPLVREGTIRERLAHVEGQDQRRKVYELPHSA